MIRKLLAALLFCTACGSAKVTTEPGKNKAPDFTLTDTDGKSVALHDLLAKGPVILAFFPKAFTGG